MSNGRGLIRGFLLGVVVTLILAAAIGYGVYRQVEKAISDESVRETAEETLARVMGGSVAIRDGEISLPNLLTLSEVSLSDGKGKMVSVDRIELIAEGGVQGLREGKFGQVILTHPTISLQRSQDTWNLVEFLRPVLGEAKAIQADASPENGSSRNELPLKLVKIVGLDFQVSLEDEALYSGISADEVILSRKDLESPWAVQCRRGKLRLNPSADEWPLAETYQALTGLMSHPTQPAPESSGNAGQPFKSPPWLGDVILEDFDLELIHPNQHLTINGLSMQADEMFELIRLQTGSLEKKTPPPCS
ncbi:MAG: hypothetical protein KC917_10060 [Candidatus Omnitrophica bacterium]|nr:hypothetical protein [Candidatus Omnitrophota bacterium]